MKNIYDKFQRPLQDVRISVIDRCNFRCTYCMPQEEYSHYSFLKGKDWLQFGEIVRLTKVLVGLGTSKIRITGGEPLLRPKIWELIEQLSSISGIEDLALTTNGALLAQQANELKKAGLHRLTVSLDTLDEKIFQKMSGGHGSVAQVLEGIESAQRAGFKSIKINTVVKKNVNDHNVLDLIKYFKGSGHTVRFIEYMDVGNCNHWENEHVVPSTKLLKIINEQFPLKPVDTKYGEVAERYQFVDGSGEVGFISSITQPFCGTCTRARISTEGKLYTCLFASEGTDLRTPLRTGASDEQLQEMISGLWSKRADKYSENRSLFQSLKEKPRKIEMFQIGG
jgi:cyclic pyranopterin phosphate synthase